MREIKFRQIKDGYTHYWGYVEHGFATPMATAEWHDTPSGQYTGLTDKNGKEIYEGDLVRINGEGPYDVYWEEWNPGWRLGTGRSWTLADGKGYEVIGNIYENPELLEPSPELGEKNE